MPRAHAGAAPPSAPARCRPVVRGDAPIPAGSARADPRGRARCARSGPRRAGGAAASRRTPRAQPIRQDAQDAGAGAPGAMRRSRDARGRDARRRAARRRDRNRGGGEHGRTDERRAGVHARSVAAAPAAPPLDVWMRRRGRDGARALSRCRPCRVATAAPNGGDCVGAAQGVRGDLVRTPGSPGDRVIREDERPSRGVAL